MSDELLNEFIFDSREHLITAGDQLLDLEKTPGSLTALNALMGTMHTIKGNSGFLDLQNLYQLLHNAESLLQTVRERQVACPQNIIELLLQVLDTVEALLERLEKGDDDKAEWLEALTEALANAGSEFELAADSAQHEIVSRKPQEDTSESTQIFLSSKKDEAQEAQNMPPLPPPKVEIDHDVCDKVEIINIADKRLAEDGRHFKALAAAMFEAGLKGLVLDLGAMMSVSAPEIKIIRALSKNHPGQVAFILDQHRQESLFRVFQILHLDRELNLFPNQSAATAFFESV